ncbi:hypothetical protein EfmJHP9_27910 [Enterococcus faecium]|nr:hypothetical protein EfmJHP9_27910 [Enterococcus faecium]
MTVVGEMCFIRAIKDIERGSLNSSRMACLTLRAMEQRRSLTESSAKKGLSTVFTFEALFVNPQNGLVVTDIIQ